MLLLSFDWPARLSDPLNVYILQSANVWNDEESKNVYEREWLCVLKLGFNVFNAFAQSFVLLFRSESFDRPNALERNHTVTTQVRLCSLLQYLIRNSLWQLHQNWRETLCVQLTLCLFRRFGVKFTICKYESHLKYQIGQNQTNFNLNRHFFTHSMVSTQINVVFKVQLHLHQNLVQMNSAGSQLHAHWTNEFYRSV